MFLVIEEYPQMKIRLLEKNEYENLEKLTIKDINYLNNKYSVDKIIWNYLKTYGNKGAYSTMAEGIVLDAIKGGFDTHSPYQTKNQ